MIKDIIIVDDPFIGTKRLLNIPTGIVSVVDDLNGLYVEEFFIRLRDYMGCIQEGIPLDWIKGKTTGTKFTITWEHEKKIYGYNLVLDKDGKVFNERLLSRKEGWNLKYYWNLQTEWPSLRVLSGLSHQTLTVY